MLRNFVRVALAALLFGAANAAASPTARCTVSSAFRTGTILTAPAYVHVDCSTTTDSDPNVRPFHDLRFVIDFGDTGSSGAGTWSRGWLGESRNVEAAPVGAHVYEGGGTFSITATVTGQDGTTSVWTQAVTVEGEDAGWSAAATRCVSESGSFAGCPPEVTNRVVSGDFDAQVQTGSGRRTLFRCGESFTADSPTSLTNSESNGSLVGGFGICAGNPVRVNVTLASNYLSGGLAGWRFRDIDFTHSGAGDQEGVFSSIGGDADRLLLLRVGTLQVGACSNHSTTVGSSATNELLAHVDYNCEMTKTTGEHWVNGFYSIRRGAIIGSRFYANSPSSQGQRISHSTNSIWAHNTYFFAGPANTLTIQFRGVDPSSGRSDQFGVVRDMRVHDEGDESLRTFVFSGGGAGMKRDYLVESIFATYNRPKSLISMFSVDVSDVSIRNNIWDLRGLGPQAGANNLVWIDPGIAQDNADGVSVHNNTIIRGGATASGLYAVNSQQGSGHRARNNLLHDLQSSENSVVGGTTGLSHSNNIHTNSGEEGCPFAGTNGACSLSPSSLGLSANEFRIRESGGARSAVLNAGFRFPDTTAAGRRDYVFRDAFAGCRGTVTGGPDDGWDIGAHEFGSVPCAPPSGSPPPPPPPPPPALAAPVLLP